MDMPSVSQQRVTQSLADRTPIIWTSRKAGRDDPDVTDVTRVFLLSRFLFRNVQPLLTTHSLRE